MGAPAHDFDFEYFYVSFDENNVEDFNRRSKIDVINEMERQANLLLQQRLPLDKRLSLMNPHKNARRLSVSEQKTRAQIASTERMAILQKLFSAAIKHASEVFRDQALVEVCD